MRDAHDVRSYRMLIETSLYQERSLALFARISWRVRAGALIALALVTALAFVLSRPASPVAHATSVSSQKPFCSQRATFCTETQDSWNYAGQYTGHDEPSVLFYSSQAGAGNSNIYRMTLPKDPPVLPKQDGTGGTFNFQLHPAFWFGMAMCDTQSAPEFTNTCTPDSDSNIFDSPDKSAPDFMGHHPGGAFMEMQFYPPSWAPWPAGNSCDARKWCAALNIDSFSQNQNTGQNNNAACLNSVGIEPVNFAFITTSGKAQAPANPVDSTLATFTPDPTQDLFMNSGDTLTVDMHDTPDGFKVVITDQTTGQQGSMIASAANSFGQVKFDPTATTCTNIPYDFHPMYSSSSEHTRLTWTAHAYNVAFSDEIGHFEYCNTTDGTPGGNCTSAGVSEPDGTLDGDDFGCFNGSQSTLVQVSGCLGTDTDFDGVPYQKVWPGTFANPGMDHRFHPTSILFTSPLFNGSQNYDRIAFEVDLPRIEFATTPPCNRNTGAGCVNPPVGSNFYPFYTTRMFQNTCTWQLGGAFIPGTKNTFGGSSAAEFGPLLQLTYPAPTATGTVSRFNDFRQVLSSNPCQV